jgi:hypothetical protein
MLCASSPSGRLGEYRVHRQGPGGHVASTVSGVAMPCTNVKLLILDDVKSIFSKRLWIQLFVSLLCILMISAFSVIEMRSVRIEERKAMLAQVTDNALSIVKDYAAQAAAGRTSVAQAQADALSKLRVLRYGQTGYCGG